MVQAKDTCGVMSIAAPPWVVSELNQKARSLRGLDPKRLGDVRELVVLLFDAGGEVGGSAHIDNLPGRFQSRRNGGIGRDHGPDICGDSLAQRIRHSARTEHTDQTVEPKKWEASLGDGGNSGRDPDPLAAGHRENLELVVLD